MDGVNYVPAAIVGFLSFGLIKSILGREFSQRCDRLDGMGEDGSGQRADFISTNSVYRSSGPVIAGDRPHQKRPL